jgi:hypothetical protein
MLQNQSDEVSGFGKEVDNKKIILPEKQIQDTKGNCVLNGTFKTAGERVCFCEKCHFIYRICSI